MMKAHPYSLLALILITLAFLFPGQAVAADIDATLPDSDNTSSFQVKNSESTDNILMKIRSGGDVGIGTTNPGEKLDVNGNVQISGTTGKLMFPNSHYDVKIELYKGGDEKIGTADNQLKLIAGSRTTDNIAFFGDSTEVMRVETGSGNVGIGTKDPNSTLHVNGSFSVKRTGISSDYTTSGENIIGVTAVPTAGLTVTLSTADCVAGRIITIKDESGQAGGTEGQEITIVTQGSEAIDGDSNVTIYASRGVFVAYSDGNDWFMLIVPQGI